MGGLCMHELTDLSDAVSPDNPGRYCSKPAGHGGKCEHSLAAIPGQPHTYRAVPAPEWPADPRRMHQSDPRRSRPQ